MANPTGAAHGPRFRPADDINDVGPCRAARRTVGVRVPNHFKVSCRAFSLSLARGQSVNDAAEQLGIAER